jgi:dTDP-4-amino-4,6-dideoxy-D-galactose acyltransferase
MSWELLPWDSGVFGFPVARIAASAHRNTLKAALDDARREGVRLIYLLTESSDVAREAQSLGGVHVSERVTFVRAVAPGDANSDASSGTPVIMVETWHGTTPTPELLELARDAGRYSRFRLDPKVPIGVFERIYDAWITNSINGTIADEVLVIRDGAAVSGLVTVGVKNGRADIGLLAVRAQARGRGLGRALVKASLDWAAHRGLREAQVVTQGANVEACRLYETCEYAIERVEHLFHFWSGTPER